jgi:carbamoyl-phosphate synthase/aspartate carbamoyltransferase
MSIEKLSIPMEPTSGAMSALHSENDDPPSTPPLLPVNGHERILPTSHPSAAAAGLVNGTPAKTMPATNGYPKAEPEPPISSHSLGHTAENTAERSMLLELEDGSAYQGYSFGTEKSVSGEMVFQTGMVGYPESITDPSYRGQILVITFPLVGNYGVPPRAARDALLEELPAHFEAAQIHVAALIVASYSGEDFSHHLASSSLGTWLKEQGVPAMHGVDTRVLTKKIREQGSMLGKLLIELPTHSNKHLHPPLDSEEATPQDWQRKYESVEWVDPNRKNLVAAGKVALFVDLIMG